MPPHLTYIETHLFCLIYACSWQMLSRRTADTKWNEILVLPGFYSRCRLFTDVFTNVGHMFGCRTPCAMRIVCVIQFCLSGWYLPLRLPNVFFKCLLHILSSDLCPQSLFFSYVNYSLCIKLLLVDHQNGAQRLNHFFFAALGTFLQIKNWGLLLWNSRKKASAPIPLMVFYRNCHFLLFGARFTVLVISAICSNPCTRSLKRLILVCGKFSPHLDTGSRNHGKHLFLLIQYVLSLKFPSDALHLVFY